MNVSNLMYFGTVAVSILATAFMARCEYLRERSAGERQPGCQEQVRTGYEFAVAVLPRVEPGLARETYAARRVQ